VPIIAVKEDFLGFANPLVSQGFASAGNDMPLPGYIRPDEEGAVQELYYRYFTNFFALLPPESRYAYSILSVIEEQNKKAGIETPPKKLDPKDKLWPVGTFPNALANIVKYNRAIVSRQSKIRRENIGPIDHEFRTRFDISHPPPTKKDIEGYPDGDEKVRALELLEERNGYDEDRIALEKKKKPYISFKYKDTEARHAEVISGPILKRDYLKDYGSLVDFYSKRAAQIEEQNRENGTTCTILDNVDRIAQSLGLNSLETEVYRFIVVMELGRRLGDRFEMMFDLFKTKADSDLAVPIAFMIGTPEVDKVRALLSDSSVLFQAGLLTTDKEKTTEAAKTIEDDNGRNHGRAISMSHVETSPLKPSRGLPLLTQAIVKKLEIEGLSDEEFESNLAPKVDLYEQEEEGVKLLDYDDDFAPDLGLQGKCAEAIIATNIGKEVKKRPPLRILNQVGSPGTGKSALEEALCRKYNMELYSLFPRGEKFDPKDLFPTLKFVSFLLERRKKQNVAVRIPELEQALEHSSTSEFHDWADQNRTLVFSSFNDRKKVPEATLRRVMAYIVRDVNAPHVRIRQWNRLFGLYGLAGNDNEYEAHAKTLGRQYRATIYQMRFAIRYAKDTQAGWSEDTMGKCPPFIDLLHQGIQNLVEGIHGDANFITDDFSFNEGDIQYRNARVLKRNLEPYDPSEGEEEPRLSDVFKRAAENNPHINKGKIKKLPPAGSRFLVLGKEGAEINSVVAEFLNISKQGAEFFDYDSLDDNWKDFEQACKDARAQNQAIIIYDADPMFYQAGKPKKDDQHAATKEEDKQARLVSMRRIIAENSEVNFIFMTKSLDPSSVDTRSLRGTVNISIECRFLTDEKIKQAYEEFFGLELPDNAEIDAEDGISVEDFEAVAHDLYMRFGKSFKDSGHKTIMKELEMAVEARTGKRASFKIGVSRNFAPDRYGKTS
jgi:hypothetical protein